MSETDVDELFKLDHRNLMSMGNSVGIILHKDELRQMGLEDGDEVIVMVKKDGTATIKSRDDT